MNRILFIKKKKGEGISTDKVEEVFLNSDNIEEIKTAVEGAEERLLVTWASVEMKDNEGELIPIDDIIKEQETLLERHGPISDTHTNRIHGETFAYKLLEHPKTHTMGLLHLDKFFNHNELDDKVWGEIVSGERKGSSVGGFNTGESKGKDEVTGEDVKVLEGFHHMETASVDEPCNPMALNEAFSTVAKSNKSNVTKPGESKLDRCVADLMDDPEFKPQAGRTKEQSAFAICQTSINKELAEKSLKQDPDGGHIHTEEDPEGEHTHPELEEEIEEKAKKGETHINKKDIKKDILNKKGDTMPKTKKTKQDVPDEEELEEEKQEEEEEEKQEEEEEKKKTKKQDDEEEPEEEEKKKQDDDEEEEKQDEEEPEEKKKEEAASDIEGETDAANEEGPKVEDPNEQTAFKAMEKKMDTLSNKLLKKIDKAVSSITTPRPGAIGNVAKNSVYENLPLMVAKGKKKISFPEATRLFNEYMDDNQRGAF